MTAPDNCFVVMPFGRKPIPDSAGRIYDFDKVYRVIIQRAIRQAGLEPVRADERMGSHMVHAEMFADLRDHPVVLADLSLLNPNVFYELGIRHVMSPSGTVLVCKQGTVLPFDVNLSRVIFYDFDGESLDWEVVETVVQRVQAGLENAKRRQPDSPVHALLDHVLSCQPEDAKLRPANVDRGIVRLSMLDGYQKELASLWRQQGCAWKEKAIQHARSPFGLRAAAYLALETSPTPDVSLGDLPHDLFFLEQYDLADLVFERKQHDEGLGLRDTLRYASCLSELDDSPAGMDRAWRVLQSGLAMLNSNVVFEEASPKQAKDAAGTHYSAGSFLAWRWRCITQDDSDLSLAISHLSEAQRWGESDAARLASEHDKPYAIGRVAHTRLLLLVLLRASERDVQRPDRERHRETIFRLKAGENQSDESISYLRWYKVIALTDAGNAQEAYALAYQALADDARHSMVAKDVETSTVAGRQYRVLRRFIENWRTQLCHVDQLGRVAQMLQGGLVGTG